MLCLGYSVTEQPGYVERANALAAEAGTAISFIKSGWGGHSLPSVAYLIDEILDALPCDFVLLELFTGAVRSYDDATIRLYLDEVLAATALRDLPVALLNLYQGGVDYDVERVAGLIREYHALYAIPCLDIAAMVWTVGGQENTFLLTDGTHVTKSGGDLYGALTYAFLRAPPIRRDYIESFSRLPRRFASIPLQSLTTLNCSFELLRNGIPLRFLEIAEGTEIEIDLGHICRVVGIMVTYGPTSGRMRFYDGGIECTILAHDPFSYYTRSFMLPIYFKATRRFRVAQLAELPDIELRKGEPDLGPRLGRVSHVFHIRKMTSVGRAACLKHRLIHLLRAWRQMIRHLFRRRRPTHITSGVIVR